MGWFKKSKSSKYASAMAKAAEYEAKAKYKDGNYEAKAEKYAKKAARYEKELEAEKAADFGEIIKLMSEMIKK